MFFKLDIVQYSGSCKQYDAYETLHLSFMCVNERMSVERVNV
jgi:hypothetical protein